MTDRRELVDTCTHHVLSLFERARGWGRVQMERLGDHSALGPRQVAAIYSLRTGEDITPGDLARRWMVTPAVITGVVDRLERQGLVRRVADPNDRRRQLLALTPAGEEARRDFEERLLDDLARQLALHSTTQLEELDRSLRLLEATFAALVERARSDLTPASTVVDQPPDPSARAPKDTAREPPTTLEVAGAVFVGAD